MYEPQVTSTIANFETRNQLKYVQMFSYFNGVLIINILIFNLLIQGRRSIVQRSQEATESDRRETHRGRKV